MKFYVAAASENQLLARKLAREIAALGHECTARWVFEDFSATQQEKWALRMAATADVRDVAFCDVFIMIDRPPQSNGRQTELGIAVTAGKEVWLLQEPGQRHNVFFNLENVAFVTDDWREMIDHANHRWVRQGGKDDIFKAKG